MVPNNPEGAVDHGEYLQLQLIWSGGPALH